MNKVHSQTTIDELIDKTPLGRIGKTDEVADMVVYLASEKSKFITGQVIEISGGFR